MLNLMISQQSQILEQYRQKIFFQELRFNLLTKMMEEKGFMSKNEFNVRWPQYLENDIGILGPDGVMKGTLKTTFYDC